MVTIKARKGVVVNASPPNGPTMLQELQAQRAEQKPNHFSFFKPALVLGVAAVGACIAGAVVLRK